MPKAVTENSILASNKFGEDTSLSRAITPLRPTVFVQTSTEPRTTVGTTYGQIAPILMYISHLISMPLYRYMFRPGIGRFVSVAGKQIPHRQARSCQVVLIEEDMGVQRVPHRERIHSFSRRESGISVGKEACLPFSQQA